MVNITDLNKRWQQYENSLIATIEVKDFQEAAGLVRKIADLADQHNHHPDISIHGYNNVTISLTSHDTGEVTNRDYKLAAALDKIL